MLRDNRECINCQKFKLPQPTRAPLTSMPIGKPWQTVAVDILTVPISTNGNKYLLVIQDYFTKWATAIPLPNQSAATITSALINLFSQMGMPDAVHSDQGRNFESTILKQSLDAFGISKSHTTRGGSRGGHRGQMTPLPICAYSKTSALNNYSNRR